MEGVHGLGTFHKNAETETKDMTTAENKRGKDEMKVAVTSVTRTDWNSGRITTAETLSTAP